MYEDSDTACHPVCDDCREAYPLDEVHDCWGDAQVSIKCCPPCDDGDCAGPEDGGTQEIGPEDTAHTCVFCDVRAPQMAAIWITATGDETHACDWCIEAHAVSTIVVDCWDCGKHMVIDDHDIDCPHCGSFSDKEIELEYRAAVKRHDALPKDMEEPF